MSMVSEPVIDDSVVPESSGKEMADEQSTDAEQSTDDGGEGTTESKKTAEAGGD
jgi:hypothetical protein